ncbi:MAG: hypothetical protein IJT26_04020 [Bacteroidales bacterium]|nr:hypothetical protein [Bacteroidales bacterium]
MKHTYKKPLAEVTTLLGEGLLCDSGAGTEDFGKGTGVGNDIFDALKPFDTFNF